MSGIILLWMKGVGGNAGKENEYVCCKHLQFFWFNFNFKHSANNASCKVWCVTNPLVRRTMQLCWVFCGNSNRFFYPKRCLGGVCDPKMALPKKLAFELELLETLTRCRLPKNREEIFWAKSDQESLGIGDFSSKLLSIFYPEQLKFRNPRSPKTTFCPLVVGNHLHGSSLKTVRWYLLFGLGLPGGWCWYFFHRIPIGSTEKDRDWKILQKVPKVFPKVWLNGDYTP